MNAAGGWGATRWARVVLPLYLGAIYATLGSIRTVSNALRDAGLLRLAVAIAFVVVGAVVLWVIVRFTKAKSWRTAVVIAAIGAAYAVVTLPMDSPEEKLHFIQYGGVALLAFAALPPRWTAQQRTLSAALFTVAAGWLDEGIQALLPERYYDLRDVGFNAAAGVMALAALWLFRWGALHRAPSALP